MSTAVAATAGRALARFRHPIHVLRMRAPVLDQLRLEEALVRADCRNWCIINRMLKSHGPAVVLGISGQPDKLVHVENAAFDRVPMIKRFSGGGTVLVDHDIIFVTFICNETSLPDVKKFPKPIMDWTGCFYGSVFPADSGFRVHENDYCFGQRKFAGNAQCITKDRWLHHTSFLWDYDDYRIDRYLKMPSKVPEYRAGRSHQDFMCRVKDNPAFAGRTPEDMEDMVIGQLADWFEPTDASLSEMQSAMLLPHDKRTLILSHQITDGGHVQMRATQA